MPIALRWPLLVALCVCCAPAFAAAPVLAVLKLQDETGGLPLQGGAGRVITNMLISELAARGSFTVVERQKLRAVLEEQDLAASGRIEPGQGAKIGRLLGADFLITGTLTAFEEDATTRVKQGFFGSGAIERVSEGGYLAVDLRVIDSSSGEIAYARTVEGRTAGSVKRMEIGERESGVFNDGPDARAIRAAVLEIVDYLECAIVHRDACMQAFADKDQRRQRATRDAARID